ncbi:hypothetical protein ACFX11_038728 [Malus domestica]
MAFWVGIKVPKWFTTLLVLAHCFKILLIVALSHLGLLKPSQEMTELEEYRRRQTNNHFVVLDRLCPSAVPVPIHVLTEYIKRKPPVVEFGQVFDKYTRLESLDTECNICLECIERSHDVREPCNCDHVFHRQCLDSWVDQGQVTCPLCRSPLFPAKSETMSCGKGSSGTIERDAAPASCPSSSSSIIPNVPVHLCQVVIETILCDGTLWPIPELVDRASTPDEATEADVGGVTISMDMWRLRDPSHNSGSSSRFTIASSPKRKQSATVDESSTKLL